MFDIQVKEKKETRTFTLKHLFYQQIDAEDEKTLETFMSSQPTERKTLADIIMEKINEKKTEIRSQISGRLHLYFCSLYSFSSRAPSQTNNQKKIISIEYFKEKICNTRDTVTQPTFTCSKSTIKTLEKGVKYVHN